MNNQNGEKKHCYGDNIHILNNPYLESLLAKFCSKDIVQPTLNHFVEIFYRQLLIHAMNQNVPLIDEEIETRMYSQKEKYKLKGRFLDKNTNIITVNLARAGTWPAHVCFNQLNYLFNPQNLRQDHFYINRKVNSNDEVIGVDVSGSKIGGEIDRAIIIFPDPMGATGSSLSHAISHYKKDVSGIAKKYIGLHLIITPEFIKNLTSKHEDVEIYSLRLDRELSTPKALNCLPGKYIDEERGLNNKHYIVPGAGGVGEILNNSYC